MQVKKIIMYGLGLVLIFGIGVWGFNLYYFQTLKPKNAQVIKTNFGELFYPKGIVTEDSIQSIINLLEQSFDKTNESLNLERATTLKVMYSFGEKKISMAYPKFKTICYYHFNSIYPPYIHEYIHTHLGFFKEYWFMEGYATYLSLKIKNEDSSLNHIFDINDNWFQKNNGGKDICNIDDLKKRYNHEEVRRFLNIESNRPKLKTLKEKIDYYKLSASFCEYLSNEIGFSEFLGLIKKSKNQSIESLLKKKNVNLEEKYTDWLNENFN